MVDYTEPPTIAPSPPTAASIDSDTTAIPYPYPRTALVPDRVGRPEAGSNTRSQTHRRSLGSIINSVRSSSDMNDGRKRPAAATPPLMDGYLGKRERRTKRKIRRYFVLCGSVLSNHPNEQSPATWMVSVLGANVDVNSRERCVKVGLRGEEITLYAEDDDVMNEWAKKLDQASTIKPAKTHVAPMPASRSSRLLRSLSSVL